MNQEYQFAEDSDFQNPADGGLPGPILGAFLSIGLVDKFPGAVDAFYIRKGYESTFVATDEFGERIGERTETVDAHYLSVPLGVRFEFQSYTVMPYLFAGIGTEIFLSRGDSGLFDDFNKVTLSGHFGIGLEWPRFGMNIRYLRDLASAADPSGSLDSVINDGVVKAYGLSVSREPARIVR